MQRSVVFLISLLTPIALAAQTAPTTRPTLWLVGDSTVRNGSGGGGNGQWGWGDRIAKSFDSAKLNVVNRARGGRSSRTFQTEGLWDGVLADAKPGDFVIIQLGHNDGGPLAGDNRERGSLRGIDEESEEVTLTLPPNKGKKEIVHTYGWYLRKYVADARSKGLTPILCSPIPRRPKTPADPTTAPLSYALWSAQVAEAEHVPFVDLNRLVLRHYAGMTPEQIKERYFTQSDDTHTNAQGADLNAAAVVEGLRALPDNPLQQYLSPQGAKGRLGPTPPGLKIGLPGRLESVFTRSFDLPERNYSVKATLGGYDVDATTTVLAEQRRLMIERLHTRPGQFVTRTFTVNLRTPQIPGGGQIKLKGREANYPNWD